MLLTRPMVAAGGVFLVVALVVSFFSAAVSFILLMLLLAGVLAAGYLFRGNRRVQVILVLLSAAVAVSSYLLYTQNKEFNAAPFDGETAVITGIVTDMQQKPNNRAAYTLTVQESSLPKMPTGFKGILYAPSDMDVDFYSQITIEAKCRAITSSPSFDFAQYYRSKGIAMTFTSYADAKVTTAASPSLLSYFKRLNQILCAVIDRHVERPYAGLMKAMLLGDDNEIDDFANDAIQRAGVSHVFVVSGLHISLLAGILLFLLKALGASLRLRCLLTIAGGWGLVALTGFGIPAVRAGIMLTVMLAANLFHRKADSLTSLFFAGILIVLVHPLAITDGSFQLTFCATLGVILFAKPISEELQLKLGVKQPALVYCVQVIAITFAANLAMFPVILYLFRGISLAAPLTNLIVVPLLPVLLIGGIFLLLFSGVSGLADFIGSGLRVLIELIVTVCEWVSAVPFAYLGLNYGFVFLWMMVTLCLLLLGLLIFRRKKELPRILAFSVAGLVICFGFHTLYNRDNVELITFSNEDAQSLVITGRSGATVIGFGDDKQIDLDIASFLRSKNIQQVDNYVFASSENKNIADTEFLARTTGVGNMYMKEDDPLLPYAVDSFRPQNGIYPLKVEGGYDICRRKNTVCSVERFDEGIIVRLMVGATKVVITDSPALGADEKCEILYVCANYNEILTQNRAKYVILLNRPQLDRLADRVDAIRGYEEQVRLSLRQNGSYQFGR